MCQLYFLIYFLKKAYKVGCKTVESLLKLYKKICENFFRVENTCIKYWILVAEWYGRPSFAGKLFDYVIKSVSVVFQ